MGLYGEEHETCLVVAASIAGTLIELERYEEAMSVLRETMPVARRVLGDSHVSTIKMRTSYACALYEDSGATLDDLRQAVTTIEEAERIVRRVLGDANRTTEWVVFHAEGARAALRALRWRYLVEASPRTIEAALSYLEEASPDALATHRVRLVALADRAAAASGESQPSTATPLYDEDALD